jgi:DNA-binding XRE family transcriptional regulator
MSRDDLAQKLGVSYWAISKYETDERSPDKELTGKIADLFSVSIDSLFGRKQQKEDMIDDLEQQWPEGKKVLLRAHNKLTPEKKRKMLRLIETYINEEEDDDD